MFKFLRLRKQDPKKELRRTLGEYELPSFSGILLTALERIRDPQSSSSSVAEALAGDPGVTIAGRILSSQADEISEIEPPLQAKLLRVLQEQQFERVGSSLTMQVDVRVISATNVNLEKAVTDGQFRKDLYYRLCVMPVTVPPLRERRGDIELLAKHFLKEFGQESYRSNVKLPHRNLSIFHNYSWPGKCRELQNVIQYALVKCQEDTIEPDHLPATLYSSGLNGFIRHRQTSKIDEQAVLSALQKAGGNKRRAAELLGVSRSTLYRFFDRQRRQS